MNNAHTGAIRRLSIGSYSITNILHPFFLNSNILFSECSLLSELLGALGGVTCLKYPFMIGKGRSYQVILVLIENFFALHNAFSHFLSPCWIDRINPSGHNAASTPGNIFSALLFFCWVGLFFAIFSFPPILLLKPLQFSPMIQKIPCCFVLGAIPWTCNRPLSPSQGLSSACPLMLFQPCCFPPRPWTPCLLFLC